ncbi:cob(I)yrinic acid a,c-diamide adenosyltransferase [Desulfurispirillum indicum]|uniref:corrinoid adenosyltransferase n=1 Tax=Desulfurispirillum indicum (strain ATCC BAA-1389 / DSM 22839 / S5) TaxID=653733 RepID=E6W0R7_DESIS|nr:ATP:corrinoid adenosyltransferase BtuR/CobO/CobP [Desulfurispirillum indicum S5]UCZ55743.1 cob(I)yrinic acid a,c-diamide adenosyltransferase [Desulfurispirillum indicum]
MLPQGYVQIYTGNGKGKTTAALGLALRCAGAGGRVFFCQFLKKGDSSEWAALQQLQQRITHRAFGSGKFIRGEPAEEDRQLARAGLEEARRALQSATYDLVVLDELIAALNRQLVSRAEIQELLALRPAHTELVLTGRNAPDFLLQQADLVSEMREVKHYFQQGVAARRGMEK